VPEAADEVRAKKDELRSRLRAERAALSADAVAAASAAVCARLGRVAAIARARVVALYAATRGEIDAAPLAAELRARGATVVYPRVDGDRLRFHAVGGGGAGAGAGGGVGALEPGTFGILAPRADAPEVALDAIEVVLVPGLAFDRGGHRVGYGRGYYDAALAAAARALRIGLCHAFQLVDTVPRAGADEPVDAIVTPDGTHATSARPAFAPEEVQS
jgi:5-formyltetrahydrofolate cyclo-ligase